MGLGGNQRLSTARKRARLAVQQSEDLLARFGARIDPAAKGEVVAALEGVKTAKDAGDVVAIYDGLKALEAKVAEHLGKYRKSATREVIESVVVAVLIALALRTFVVEAFTIPSGSMIPTLAVGDFLFVNKLSYGVRIPFVDKMAAQWDVRLSLRRLGRLHQARRCPARAEHRHCTGWRRHGGWAGDW